MNGAALPSHIDKYEIVRLLGRGATSSVYLAYDAFTERQVALKHFHAEYLSDPEHGATYRKLIATEASLAGRLNHPHIVGILDAARGEGNTYIVMEYVEGETLEKYAQPDTLLPVDKVIEIVFKCALALDFASRNGIIHRDIKPANIMLTKAGDVKIADFGAAQLMKSEATQVLGVGSPAYMSPEQIRMDALTHQTDIYSLGVVLFRLLTGRLPFEADSNVALAQKILSEPAPDVRSLRPSLSPRLAAIVARALEKDTARRYATWHEFAADLARFAALDLPQETISETEKFHTLRELPFFAHFSDIELWEVLRISVWGRVPAGTHLVNEGDEGNFFFIIADGEVRVTKAGRDLGVKPAGTCFGEMCYLRQGAMVRTATVIAVTPVTLLKIKAQALAHASERCQLAFNRAFLDILVDRLAETDEALVNTRRH
ncbi:MAG: serine/threonine-protein kinase [Rhodocyclaceae bacterium]|nr:serine/threonine-protein kinase [Rhodocyclaceae bacterium]